MPPGLRGSPRSRPAAPPVRFPRARAAAAAGSGLRRAPPSPGRRSSSRVAGGLDGRDHGRVVVARRVAEPVRRGRRSAAGRRCARRPPGSAARAASSVIRSAWLKPCVSSSQPAATRARPALAEPALGGRQPAELEVLVADPAEPAQHRQRLGVLRLVAVVEAEHDRLARAQRRAVLPVARTWSSVTAW